MNRRETLQRLGVASLALATSGLETNHRVQSMPAPLTAQAREAALLRRK